MTQATLLSHLLQQLVSCAQQDPILSSLVTGIYEYVPQGTALPYIRISFQDISDEPAGFSTLLRVGVTADIWTNYRGISESLTIADRLENLLTMTMVRQFQHFYMISWHLAEQSTDMMKDNLTRRHRLLFNGVLTSKEETV